MATQAVDLGRFASEQGPISRLASVGGALGLAAAGVSGVAVALYTTGAGTLEPRPYAVPLGGAALLVSIVGLYRIATTDKRGRPIAISGALLGVAGGVAALVQGSIQSGTLRLDDFGVAYFDRAILAAIWRDIRYAAANTMKYAGIAEGFGIAIGLVVAVLAISKSRWLRIPAIAYVDVIRGLPLLMLIILVVGGPVFIGIVLPSLTAGLIALTINSSAYVAEIFRAGIQAVDRGQMDAARSVGMPYPTAMVHVVIPQAFRKVIPPLTNEFIALVKDTSLLFAVGLTLPQMELLTRARTLSSSTFSLTPLVAAAIAYLIITLPLIRVVTYLERRLLSGDQLLPMRLRVMRPSGRGPVA